MLNKKRIVLVDNELKEKIEIPVFFLNHWKTILILGATIIVLLVVALCIILNTFQEVNNHYEKEIISDRIEAEQRLLDLNKYKQENNESGGKVSKIDSTINKLNEKMIRRGLSPIYIPNMGGPVENENSIMAKDYYQEAIEEIDQKLTHVPLGVPHFGNITSRYGYRRNPFTRSGKEAHLGIDFSGRPGDKIRATAKGKVLSTGYQGGYGFVVKIMHTNGFETRYAHLSGILVRPGQTIEAGTEIGLLGSTGRSTGPHVHYEILKNNKKINPEKYIYF